MTIASSRPVAGSLGSSSSRARSGVMPIPAPMSSDARVRAAPACMRPYGPSTRTRVPGVSVDRRREPSPTIAAVKRSSTCPSSLTRGAADSEYGFARVTPGPPKRHCRNWPARASSAAVARPTALTLTTPGAISSTFVTRRPARWVRASGSSTRNTMTVSATAAYRAHQNVVATGEARKSRPVHSWCGRARPTPR